MRKKFISADFLKIFAVLLMVTDHASEVIIENNLMCNTSSIEELVYWVKINEVLRGIGRLGFPIFAFLLVEGILHTHDVKKYITRMAVFAVISEIPYDYACNGGFTWAGQNIFLTLTLALIMIVVFQKIEKKPWADGQKWLGIFVVCLIFAVINTALGGDYGASGIFMIGAIYFWRNHRLAQCILAPAVFLGSSYVARFVLTWMAGVPKAQLWALSMMDVAAEWPAIFAFIFIFFYNGERRMKKGKYFFYAFYPVHLAILAVIARFLI